MSEAIKVLGQAKPAAVTLTSMYTVPPLASTVVSTIVVCNQAGTPTTYRLSVAVAGAADAAIQYITYDVPLLANETQTLTLGLTLGAADVVRCYSGSGSVSFSAFGAETT